MSTSKTTIDTVWGENKRNKPCLTCGNIAPRMLKKTRQCVKRNGASSACTMSTYHYCSEDCLPEELPASKSVAIAGESISTQDFLKMLV